MTHHTCSMHVASFERECVMTHLYVCHDSFASVPWLICMCTMTHLLVCHDSFVRVPWLMCTCTATNTHTHISHMSTDAALDMSVSDLYGNHDSFMCVTWLIHMCDMTHLCVWHDSFMCVTWLILTCDILPTEHQRSTRHECIRVILARYWKREFGQWPQFTLPSPTVGQWCKS